MNSKQPNKTPQIENMSTQKVEYNVYQRNTLPDNILEQLPVLMQDMQRMGYGLPPASTDNFVMRLAVDIPKHIQETWIIATVSDKLTGYCTATRTIAYENTNRVFLNYVYVIKAMRERGIGKKIVNVLLEQLPSEVSILEYWAIEKTAGQEFMKAVFQKPAAFTVRQSASEVRNFDLIKIQTTVQKLVSNAESKNYELLFIDDADFENVVNLEEYIQATEAIYNDMPLEELTLEKTVIDEDRFLQGYESGKKTGNRYMTFVALYQGKIAAMTEVMINKFQEHVAWQKITGVVKEHRGNRLGLTLKFQMLDKLLRDTEAKYWFTDNSGTNIHMIRINDELGFKELPKGFVYEIAIKEIRF